MDLACVGIRWLLVVLFMGGGPLGRHICGGWFCVCSSI